MSDGLIKAFQKAVDDLSDFTGNRAWRERLPHPNRPGCHTLRIPGYRQVQSFTCGFVVAANVLYFFKPEADLESLYDELDWCDRMGTYTEQVMKALRTRGLTVVPRRNLDWQGLCQVLAEGKPVIAVVSTRLGLHWVVIYGYDLDRQTLFVCGLGTLPELNRKEIRYQDFVGRWQPPGNGLVCSCKDSRMHIEGPKPTAVPGRTRQSAVSRPTHV
jgi:hypothetical protein